MVIDYGNTIIIKTISTTNSNKGYFALDVFTNYSYIAVSYNDNYDSEDIAKLNYR